MFRKLIVSLTTKSFARLARSMPNDVLLAQIAEHEVTIPALESKGIDATTYRRVYSILHAEYLTRAINNEIEYTSDDS